MSPRNDHFVTMSDLSDVDLDDDNQATRSHNDEITTATPSYHHYGYGRDEGNNRHAEEEQRDERKEIQKQASKETARIRSWRYLVTLVLIATAVAVTVTTYLLLVNEEYANFDHAYVEYSTAMKEAAIGQQRDIRDAFEGLSHSITAYAQSTNATWPYFTMPLFESYAMDTLKHAKTEVLGVASYVRNDQQTQWIEYANQTYEGWVEEGHMIRHGNLDRLMPMGYHPFHTRPTPKGFVPDVDTHPYYFPFWQFSPAPATYGAINWNMVAVPDYEPLIEALIKLKNETVVSRVRPFVSAQGLAFTPEEHQARHSKLPESSAEHPHSFHWYPIHEKVRDTDSKIVALVATGGSWDVALRDLLPECVEGIIAIIRNACIGEDDFGQTYTYEIRGNDALYRGEGDLHEGEYDSKRLTVDLNPHTHRDYNSTPGHCLYYMDIYPTDVFEASYHSNTPAIYAAVVAGTFLMVAIVFVVYDVLVQRRNEKIINNAAQTSAIVTQMFPSHIRDQLIANKSSSGSSEANRPFRSNTKSQMKSFLAGSDKAGGASAPIADLFLETTIMFADITGFTAWSSVREPSQVFQLLEAIYGEFDIRARRRRVFKVETVGDCYVAVTGLPDFRKDHAMVMAKFAHDCLICFDTMAKNLEVSLGPDTGDLSLRIGIHSGPVTAGVLRGERARFQLFGDTVNVCARMEQTGIPGRIQISSETAELIAKAGKNHWLKMRDECIEAKGKGSLRTFWFNCKGETSRATSESSFEDFTFPDNEAGVSGKDPRLARLIDWNVETLGRLLKQIIGRREACSHGSYEKASKNEKIDNGHSFLEEVKEIIELPEFDCKAARRQQDPDSMELDPKVAAELHDYIACIASMYRDNPFHNFEHASHVVMSVIKCLSRIIAPSELEKEFESHGNNSWGEQSNADSIEDDQQQQHHENKFAATLHDHTYGITSDPLTQFACAFSALIHDVDHSGVPNNQLVKENSVTALVYNNRSVAEQNSLALSWNLLFDDRFCNLRSSIFKTSDELKRFRELVVNSVIATDIADKDLIQLRNNRWDKAFRNSQESVVDAAEDSGNEGNPKEGSSSESSRDAVNRKATIVIEHLIQASDISHTMQHWHVYRKWNERLFEEMYIAYRQGRSESSPANFWAKGEIGFFDFYIIPLAKKLKECGVFGVSSGEFLNYALQNRREWEAKGHEVVEEMMEKFGKKEYPKYEGEMFSA